MNLGEGIKTLRKQNNLSQEQLAENLNVSRQAVSKWESNIGYPDISNLILLRDIFGFTLDYLVIDNNTIEVQDIDEDVNSFDNTKLCNIKLKKRTIEEDNKEYEDDYDSNLILAGFAIGIAIGILTCNFLWGRVGSFIGMGASYILKNTKIKSK